VIRHEAGMATSRFCELIGLFANEGVGAIAGWGGRGLP
jgi:hypothetical protein